MPHDAWRDVTAAYIKAFKAGQKTASVDVGASFLFYPASSDSSRRRTSWCIITAPTRKMLHALIQLESPPALSSLRTQYSLLREFLS